MLAKTNEDDSPAPTSQQARGRETASNDSEQENIKDCPKTRWDPLADFISERCVMSGVISRHDLYHAYIEWSAKTTKPTALGMSTQRFTTLLRGRGIKEWIRTPTSGRGWTGINLKEIPA
jgi:phage/plasmid-associated DNA primase